MGPWTWRPAWREGQATEAELEEARVAAQFAVKEAKHAAWRAEAQENFHMTPRYASFCWRLSAAQAARGTVCRDPRVTDGEADSYEAHYWNPSHDAAVWALGKEYWAGLEDKAETTTWEAITESVNRIESAERRAHCQILFDLFGEYMGAGRLQGQGQLASRSITASSSASPACSRCS